MRLEVLKTYRDEMAIAVIMPWPYKENPLNLSGVVYNKTVTWNLYYRLFNGISGNNYKKVKGILARNKFIAREYRAGITNLYI